MSLYTILQSYILALTDMNLYFKKSFIYALICGWGGGISRWGP